MQDFIVKGGPVLWIIMGLSFVAVAIAVERLLFFRKIDTDENKLFERVRSALAKGHVDEALTICDSNLSPLSALVKASIEHRDAGESARKEAIKDAASRETPRLERGIPTIGTIAHIAPLLGLLGTVTGTMKAFGVLGTFGAVSDPSMLARGVSEALITTVGGIVVAVPAVILYNMLATFVNRMLSRIEGQVNDLILMVDKARRGES